jgi:hypothetical protein
MSAYRFILTVAASTMLAACGHGSLDSDSTSIVNGRIMVRADHVELHGKGGVEAILDAAGNMVVDGHATATDAPQREQLKQYYQAAKAVRDHGIATGKAGAAIAADSLKNVVTHLFSGHGAKADAKLEASTQRIRQEASKICLDVQQIKAAQDRLATSLPAFQPFAGIVGNDGATCSSGS